MATIYRVTINGEHPEYGLTGTVHLTGGCTIRRGMLRAPIPTEMAEAVLAAHPDHLCTRCQRQWERAHERPFPMPGRAAEQEAAL